MERQRIEAGSFFPMKFIRLILLANLIPMLLPLVSAALISMLAARYRVRTLAAEGIAAAYAPLWRRAVAATLDGAIAVGPLAAGYVWVFSNFSDFFDLALVGPQAAGGKIMAMGLLMMAGQVWGLAAYFLFSFTQGRWGGSPGKWLLGIRVRGADLKPCGFGRALLRNLLWVADVCFGGLVALVVAALTEKFQRVGDLVAGTVVVRARAGRPPQQR